MKESVDGSGETSKKEMKIIPYHKRSIIWIGIALTVLIMSRVLPVSFFEKWYYEGIFRWFRVTYDYILGWSPVPMIYVVVLVMLVQIVKWANDWTKGFWYQMTRVLGGLAMIIS